LELGAAAAHDFAVSRAATAAAAAAAGAPERRKYGKGR